MTKTTPILLDRLAGALAEHGITLKRTHLLQIAAKAFGYPNTHQLTADEKEGNFSFPSADYLDTIETDLGDLAILGHPEGGIFAVEKNRFLEKQRRAADLMLSPYGGLINVEKARSAALAENGHEDNIHVLSGHEEDPYVACGNCLWIGRESECNPITDVTERVMPGEIMPAGECPECGAVTHAIATKLDDPNGANKKHHGIDPEVPIYLTNGCCESCIENGKILDAFGLEYGTFEGDFYPLTKAEETYIAEDVVTSADGRMHALTGYSALYRGEKYIMPSIELPVGREYDAPDPETVRKTAENYAKAILPKVESLGGNVLIDNGIDECVVIQILIPFTTVMDLNQTWYETMRWMMVDPRGIKLIANPEYRYEGKEFAVTTSWIGEGNNGDYNPMTLNDHPLLRFDVQRKNTETGDWEDVDDGSYCTQIHAYAPQKILEALPRYLTKQLDDQGGHYLKRLMEKLSWTNIIVIEEFLRDEANMQAAQ